MEKNEERNKGRRAYLFYFKPKKDGEKGLYHFSHIPPIISSHDSEFIAEYSDVPDILFQEVLNKICCRERESRNDESILREIRERGLEPIVKEK